MKRAALLAMLALAIGLSPARAAESEKYLIQFTGGIPADVADLIVGSGGSLLRSHPQIGWVSALSTDPRFAPLMAGRRGVAAVHRDLAVDAVAPLVGKPLATVVPKRSAGDGTAPDPSRASLFPCQWNLRQIDAPGAWAQGAFGSPSVKVAIVDTGADATHVDLAGRIDPDQSTSLIVPGTSECGAEDEETFDDFLGHGTFLASLVTSNGVQLAAVAPATQVVAIKVIDCQGQSGFSDLIAGILYAADLPDVTSISVSLGAFVNRNEPGARELIRAARDAVDYAFAQGKLVVTVAGNQHLDLREVRAVAVPTESGQAVGVYATDVRGNLASYSNWGFPASWIGAPGGDNLPPKRPFPGCSLPYEQQGRILGACASRVCGGATDQYLTGRGTSLSAPLVAAVAALVDGEADGSLSGNRIKIILKKRADDLGEPGTDPIFGHGRVNAARAVRR